VVVCQHLDDVPGYGGLVVLDWSKAQLSFGSDPPLLFCWFQEMPMSKSRRLSPLKSAHAMTMGLNAYPNSVPLPELAEKSRHSSPGSSTSLMVTSPNVPDTRGLREHSLPLSRTLFPSVAM